MKELRGSTKPWVVRIQPGRARLRPLVDERHNRGGKIMRDLADVPFFCANGQHLTGGQAMRQGVVKTTAEHLAALSALYPDEESVLFAGFGNLYANDGVVLWMANELHHHGAEPVYHQPYTCVLGMKDGAVVVREVLFAHEHGRAIVLLQEAGNVKELTDDLEVAFSGELVLIRNGVAEPLERLSAGIDDTRHVVSPFCIHFNGTTAYVPGAQLHQGLVVKAASHPVAIELLAQVDPVNSIPLALRGWLALRNQPEALARVTAFLRETHLLGAEENLQDPGVLLRTAEHVEGLRDRALAAAEITIVDDGRPLRRGEARYVNNHLEVFSPEALYPHNVFVSWPDGSYGFVVWPGKSGRAGTTLRQAQEVLLRLGVQSAIVLDNGADVRLSYRGQYLVPSSDGREEIRALLAVTMPKGTDWTGVICVS